MAHSNFNVDGAAFGDSTRQLIRPDHIMPIHEAVDGDIPPERREEAADTPENSVLRWIMEDACDSFQAFREFECYVLVPNYEPECEVPEDEIVDEMEETSSDEDQLVPKISQEEEGESVSLNWILLYNHVDYNTPLI